MLALRGLRILLPFIFWRHVMKDKSKVVFVGLDVAKDTLAVSVADEGRDGEIRDWGTVSSTP